MKAKRYIATAIAAGICASGLLAAENNGLKVYINPGHGGHESNDRNVVIYPYAQGDPNGYWESNSNLDKGLALRDMLLAKGYQVKMSRTTNTEDDDLGLSTIVRLANDYNADIFFSIHSNATGTVARRNFPLMLFRGYDNEPLKPKDKVVCEILNRHLLENEVTYWTSTNTNVRGDWSFYPSWGTSGLGVLRGLTITGMLSEGSFHDYIPEAYRLMSKDFCWLEAFHFRKAIDEFFSVAGEETGSVFGRLNDNRLPRDGSYTKFGDDLNATIQNAKVELYDAAGKLVDTYTTDPIHVNGIYAFKNLAPGKYTVKASVDTHYPVEKEVEVTANTITYANMTMSRVRSTAPVAESYSPVWKEGDEAVLCNTPIVIQFNWDMDVEATEKAFKIDPPVEGVFTWEDLNYRLVFTPNEPYATNTLYTVTLGTDAKHPGNMNLEQPLTFKFLTTDRNFMEIIGQFPKHDEEVHYKKAYIEFRFDKRPNVSKILKQISCTDSKGNKVSFNNRGMSNSSSKNSPYGFFRIPFGSNLTVGETYKLELSGEFADHDGITIKEPVSVTFKAVDAGEAKNKDAVEDMENADLYSLNTESSIAVASNSVKADKSEKLFGTAAVTFNYEFEGTEGGEALWERSTNAELTLTDADKAGVHIYGDLTDNEVYLEFTGETGVMYAKVCNMDFLGWRYIPVDLTALEGGLPYSLSGIRLVQKSSMMSKSGAFKIDDIYKLDGEGSGVADVDIATVSVYPNPASEYIIANGGIVIESLTLVSLDGVTVASRGGNVLNVSDIAAGNYIVIVKTASGSVAKKVIIKH